MPGRTLQNYYTTRGHTVQPLYNYTSPWCVVKRSWLRLLSFPQITWKFIANAQHHTDQFGAEVGKKRDTREWKTNWHGNSPTFHVLFDKAFCYYQGLIESIGLGPCYYRAVEVNMFCMISLQPTHDTHTAESAILTDIHTSTRPV